MSVPAYPGDHLDRCADKAIATGEIVIAEVVIESSGLPTYVMLIPDVLMAEFIANGSNPPEPMLMEHPSGRTVYAYRAPEKWTKPQT